MSKELRKLHNKIVKGKMPVKDLEREMKNINKLYPYEQDFETIANSKGITVRELVTNWDFYVPEENNY